MLLKLELRHQKIRFACLFRGLRGVYPVALSTAVEQHHWNPSPVMQSCAARLNARLTKQSVNCELLCVIPLCTFTTSESMRSWPLQRSGGSSCGFSLPGVSSSPLSVCHQLNLTSAQVVFPAFLIVPSLLYLGEPVKGTSKCTSCPCT